MLDDLIFLSCQPHDPYFQWQIEVQIVNFRKFGISDKMHIIVWYRKDSMYLNKWEQIQKKYPEVNIFFYEDSGVDLGLYISQLRPHSIKKHFAKYPELKEKTIFYHDSDIIFNKLPDFEELLKGDIWWQSDTSSYLDYNYLQRKEIEGNIPDHYAIHAMANIGGIPFSLLKSYADNTGGAQYILRAVDSEFWQDVESMCIRIRKKFWWGTDSNPNENSINYKYFTSPAKTSVENENSGFQSWCADMWAINFAIWKRGYITQVTDKLDFSWATDDYETFLRKPIFHNAGANSTDPNIFYKGAYIGQSPLYQNLPLPPENRASRAYVQAINEVNL